MQENVYVRTVGLDCHNYIKIANDLRKWLTDSTVYVQNDPVRIVVIYADCGVVINEGDVFSFMQKATGRKHYIVNHSEKRDTVRVKISSYDFIIETFVYSTVGSTENMKFRLTCLNEIDLSGEFDDYEALKNRLNEFLREAVEVIEVM